MASTSDLTDVELRQELKNLGENPGPINANTRDIYRRKLDKLKSSKATNSPRISSSSISKIKLTKGSSRKHIGGFSSDDSDKETVQTRKKTSTPFSQRKSTRRTYTSDDSPANNKLSDRSPPQLSKTSSKKISNGYSDDSDDANDSRGSWVQVSSAVTNTSPGLFSSSPNSFVSKRRSLRNRSLPFGNLLRDQDSPTPTKSPENNDVEPDKLDSAVPPSFKHPDPYESPLTVKKETRNGGDLVRRRVLTQAMKQNSLKKSKTQISNNSSPNTHNSSPNSSSPSWSRSLLRRLRSPSRSSPDSTRLAWPLRCSVLIPFCFVGFFVILGLLYVTMRTDDVTSRLPNLSSTTPMEHDESVMKIVNRIYEILAVTVGNNLCEEANISNRLSLLEVESKVQVGKPAIKSALKLIRDHEEWNIFLYKDEEPTLLTSQDSVASVRFLETTAAILPTFCRLERAVYKVLYHIGLVLFAVLLIWILVLFRNYRRRKSAEERKEMFALVEVILDVLRKHHESSADNNSIEPFIPIVHVRDMVIPSHERQTKLKIWEMAVRFISASESRVRVETQRVSGEDYRVWRWIQVTTPAKRNQPPKRVWQGTAIVTNRSINTPNINPTPCLKIRHMFDPESETGEDWEVQIHDSILEKCSDNDDILSIVIEKQSKEGLVYVKCSSCAGAGRTFRSLHGVWFDGRLVTVKFITLQRFHYRYPHTLNQISPLQKSLPFSVSTFAPQEDVPGIFSTSTPVKTGN